MRLRSKISTTNQVHLAKLPLPHHLHCDDGIAAQLRVGDDGQRLLQVLARLWPEEGLAGGGTLKNGQFLAVRIRSATERSPRRQTAAVARKGGGWCRSAIVRELFPDDFKGNLIKSIAGRNGSFFRWAPTFGREHLLLEALGCTRPAHVGRCTAAGGDACGGAHGGGVHTPLNTVRFRPVGSGYIRPPGNR